MAGRTANKEHIAADDDGNFLFVDRDFSAAPARPASTWPSRGHTEPAHPAPRLPREIVPQRAQDTTQKRRELEAGTLDGIGWENPTQDCLSSDHIRGGGKNVKAMRMPYSEVIHRGVGKGCWRVSVPFVLSGLPLTAQRHRDMSRHQEAEAHRWLDGVSDGENEWAWLGQL